MPRYAGRKSRREQMLANAGALAYYSAISGRPTPPELAITIPESIKRKPRTSDPAAPPLERDVLKAVWHYLARHPKVAWITRMNAGTAMADFGAGGQHPIRFNYKRGMSDLLGQLRDGRLIAVECKRGGIALQDHQREFLNEVLTNKGVAFVARSVEDAIEGMANV